MVGLFFGNAGLAVAIESRLLIAALTAALVAATGSSLEQASIELTTAIAAKILAPRFVMPLTDANLVPLLISRSPSVSIAQARDDNHGHANNSQ